MSVIIGLTGQSGAGKSAVCEAFREEGFAVIDCDKVSRSVTESGSDCNKELSKYFPECFDEGFTLDRRKMAETVFSDGEKLELLESIIFKYITAEIENHIDELSEKSDYIILDAPTLFEAGIEDRCSAVVGIVSPLEKRLQRIMLRDGISEEDAMRRFSSQHDEDFFRERCGFIIENDGELPDALEKARETARKIRGIYS